MDMEVLASLVPVRWISDRVNLAQVTPKHIGRVISFDNMLSNNEQDYESEFVMGMLDAIIGQDWIVSGDAYNDENIKDVKIYRREIK